MPTQDNNRLETQVAQEDSPQNGGSLSDLSLVDLLAAALKAQDAYKWTEALDIYNQALAREEIPADSAYELHDGRAACHRRLGPLDTEEAELAITERLADDLDDPARQIQTLNHRAWLFIRQGLRDEALDKAQTALSLARNIGDRTLEARSLTRLSSAYGLSNEFTRCREIAQEALNLYSELGDQVGKAWAQRWYGRALYGLDLPQEAEISLKQALSQFRHVGNREGEGAALNTLGVYASLNFAQRRDYYEQALIAFEAAGSREYLATIFNNLSCEYRRLGLFGRSGQYIEKAIEINREAHKQVSLTYNLDCLGRTLFGIGLLEEAAVAFE